MSKRAKSYVKHIKYDTLRDRINKHSAFIIEGVCLLQIVEQLGVDLDYLIYVKRMNRRQWIDENQCEFPFGVKQAIDETRRVARSAGVSERKFEEELIHYHAKYHPYRHADILFCKDISTDT